VAEYEADRHQAYNVLVAPRASWNVVIPHGGRSVRRDWRPAPFRFGRHLVVAWPRPLAPLTLWAWPFAMQPGSSSAPPTLRRVTATAPRSKRLVRVLA